MLGQVLAHAPHGARTPIFGLERTADGASTQSAAAGGLWL